MDLGVGAAVAVSHRGTCARRQIGCVFLAADGQELSVGWNGPPAALGGCYCPAKNLPAGQGDAATTCYGVHAEVRAMLNCDDVRALHTVVSTKAPCTACTLMLLETPCRRIAFVQSSNETTNEELWLRAGREWVCLTQ